MKELFQSYIYTEQALCHLYKCVAKLADTSDEKELLMNFSEDCHEAASLIHYFYHQEFGDIYSPLIPEFEIQGTYQEVLNDIHRQELESFLKYRRHTYFPKDKLVGEMMRNLADSKLAHIVTITALVIDEGKVEQKEK